MMPAIKGFQGEYRFLSNFWYAYVEYEGVVYPTLEHAFVAAKTDVAEFRKAVPACATPGDAKRLGKQLKLRAGWDDMKVGIMRNLIRDKFSDPDLQRLLLATGDAELVEDNTWYDTFWGVCYGEGQNWLGRLLMEIREELRGQ